MSGRKGGPDNFGRAGAGRKMRATKQQVKDETREKMKEQIKEGTLIVRQATAEEREQWKKQRRSTSKRPSTRIGMKP